MAILSLSVIGSQISLPDQGGIWKDFRDPNSRSGVRFLKFDMGHNIVADGNNSMSVTIRDPTLLVSTSMAFCITSLSSQ